MRIEGEEENIAELLSLKDAARNLEARDRSIIYFAISKAEPRLRPPASLA